MLLFRPPASFPLHCILWKWVSLHHPRNTGGNSEKLAFPEAFHRHTHNPSTRKSGLSIASPRLLGLTLRFLWFGLRSESGFWEQQRQVWLEKQWTTDGRHRLYILGWQGALLARGGGRPLFHPACPRVNVAAAPRQLPPSFRTGSLWWTVAAWPWAQPRSCQPVTPGESCVHRLSPPHGGGALWDHFVALLGRGQAAPAVTCLAPSPAPGVTLCSPPGQQRPCVDEGGPSDHTWPSFLLPGGAHCLSKGAAARGLKAPIGSSWTPWPAPGWSVACQAFLPAVDLAAKIREKQREGQRLRFVVFLFRGQSEGSPFSLCSHEAGWREEPQDQQRLWVVVVV